MNRVMWINLMLLLLVIKNMVSFVSDIRNIVNHINAIGAKVINVDLTYFRVLIDTDKEQHVVTNYVMYSILICIAYNIVELLLSKIKKHK
jgi:uncharacterized protein YkvS